MKRQWIFCKRKRIILSTTYLATRTKLRKKTKLCKSDLKLKKDKLQNSRITITIFKTIQVLLVTNWMRNSLEKERKWMKDVINCLRKFQSEIEQFFRLKIKKKLLVTNYSTKTRLWKSRDKKLNKKSSLWSQRMRISRPNTNRLLTSSLKVKSTSKEKRLLKIKRLLSRSRESKTIIIRWNKLLIGTKSGLRVRKKMHRRFYKKEFKEFNRKKKTLRRSTNKRENL